MHSLLVAIYIYFLSPLLTLLLFLIFAYVIMSWLVAFGVVSMRNQTVRQIQYALDSVMLPMLRPIQRYVPPLGQLDLSVFLLALGIMFTKDWLLPTIINMTAPSIGYRGRIAASPHRPRSAQGLGRPDRGLGGRRCRAEIPESAGARRARGRQGE